MFLVIIGCVVLLYSAKSLAEKNNMDPGLFLFFLKILVGLISLLNVLVLGYAVIKIRSVVKSLNNSFPNEKFIKLHLINVLTYTMLLVIRFAISNLFAFRTFPPLLMIIV